MRRSSSAAMAVAVLLVTGWGSQLADGRALPPFGQPPAVAAARIERAEPRGSDDWEAGRLAHRHQVAAYTTRVSGVPGTRVGVKVSTTAPRYRVEAYRIGAYPGGTGTLAWRSRLLPGRAQPRPVLRPAGTRTVVAPWRRGLTVDTTGWLPGFYVFKVRTDTGWHSLVPYVVSSPSTEGTVALVAPAATWQAYNTWGGYSLYHGPPGDRRSWAVSFDRPYALVPGANDFRTAVLPVVVAAERLGIPLSYLADVDLEARPEALRGALGYVSPGHDEYWTPTMRRAVLSARDSGTNLAFLGANTMYWRVRLADAATGRDRMVVGYRSDAWEDPLWDRAPSRTTARWRDPPAPRPENDLVGMEYECYPVDAPYQVVSPHWWGFRGTGVDRGDAFAGLVGPEADRVYPDSRTPRPLQVLSHTGYDCLGSPTSSESVYYTTPSGAGVFSSGTLRWGCALVDACDVPLGARTRRFVGTVTANLLRGYAAGPVGARHPARDNVAEFDLPVTNAVPAS